MGLTDAQRVAIMTANERAQSEARIAQANRMRMGLGSVANAAGGIVGDFSAAPGMQNPILTNATGILGESLVGNATARNEVLKRIAMLRRDKVYKDELSGGVSSLGGFDAVYNPTTTTSGSTSVFAR